jgi:hypothetical protein
VGFQWAGVPNNVEQILTDVQIEMANTSTQAPTVPQAYQRPRQLQVTVKPSRLNYITNPAFQVSSAGWTQIGSTVQLAQDGLFPANLANYNNTPYTVFQSGRVTLNSALDQGVQIQVPFLIPGEPYMCSFYVMPGTGGLTDILASCANGSSDLANLILPQYSYGGGGTQGYGAGPYGGIGASNTALPTGSWTRMSFTFTPTVDNPTLFITSTLVTPNVFPQWFDITAVMIEPGQVLEPYFDGNSGPDAMWETGGTPGLSRSYFYTQFQFGQSIVTSTLNSNTPLGISYSTPLYAVVPSQ